MFVYSQAVLSIANGNWRSRPRDRIDWRFRGRNRADISSLPLRFKARGIFHILSQTWRLSALNAAHAIATRVHCTRVRVDPETMTFLLGYHKTLPDLIRSGVVISRATANRHLSPSATLNNKHPFRKKWTSYWLQLVALVNRRWYRCLSLITQLSTQCTRVARNGQSTPPGGEETHDHVRYKARVTSSPH